jgi:hypothetical protein
MVINVYIYATAISSFLNIISENLNAFILSFHEFKNYFTVEMGLLHLQLFTVLHEQPDK